MASQNVQLLLSGYVRLTAQEQAVYVDELNKLREKINKGLIKEGGRLDHEISLGPMKTGCPCCGR